MVGSDERHRDKWEFSGALPRLNEELRLYLYENYKRCFERKLMMNEELE